APEEAEPLLRIASDPLPVFPGEGILVRRCTAISFLQISASEAHATLDLLDVLEVIVGVPAVGFVAGRKSDLAGVFSFRRADANRWHGGIGHAVYEIEAGEVVDASPQTIGARPRRFPAIRTTIAATGRASPVTFKTCRLHDRFPGRRFRVQA